MYGIDLAKTVFQLHAVDADGATVIRKRLRRTEVLSFLAGLEPCLIGMEACVTSHYCVGLGLVLTHECDIDQNNERHFNDLFLVCPIIPLDFFCARCELEEGPGSWGGILPQIASQNVHRAMYLAPMHNAQICPEMEGGGIIYLNHVSSCAVRWITDPATQAVCSLTAEGLRAFDAKLYNHLFRPKVAQLLFSR